MASTVKNLGSAHFLLEDQEKDIYETEEYLPGCTSLALENSLSTAQMALDALDKISSCVWSRLVLAQAEIEALHHELRSAKEGEERAYEALKRLRTRAHIRARSSSRPRLELQEKEVTVSSNVCQLVALDQDDRHQRAQAEISYSDKGHLISLKERLLSELQIAHERLADGARREEDLRKTLSKAQEKLAGDYWANVGKDNLHLAIREQVDELRGRVVDQNSTVAELRYQLEQEKIVSARHREVAATVGRFNYKIMRRNDNRGFAPFKNPF